MAQIVKLRRSAVAGKKPTNSQLELGELSINTTDGKVYFAKSGSLGPSIEELVSTNTVNTGSIFLTGNVTASYFSGSFIGDGTGLYNVPASGVTGLQLDQIGSGSVTASISPDHGFRVNTDTSITGSLTVSGGFYTGDGQGLYNIPASGITGLQLNQIGDGTATASISQANGLEVNTNTSISGSLNLSGSLILSGSIIDGSGSAGQQDYFLSTDGNNVFWKPASFGTTYFKSQAFTTPSTGWTFTHNLKEKYPIINVYDVDGNQMLPTQITLIDENTANITFSSEQVGYVSATIGGLFRTFNLAIPSSTWVINHNFGEDNPFVQVYNSNDEVILPNEIQSINNSVNTTTITFKDKTQNGKVTIVGSGSSFKKTIDTPSSGWTITHNLNQLYPVVQVYDLSDKIMVPKSIVSIDENTLFISFPLNISGTVHVTVGGASLIPTIDNNYDGYVLATDGNSSYWKGGILSGSAGISDLGFATTGSNTFVGSQTVSGSILPSKNNTYSLGSSDYQWKHVYISTGSLYINGINILSLNQNNQVVIGGTQVFNTTASTSTGSNFNGNLVLDSDLILQNTGSNVETRQGVISKTVSSNTTMIDLGSYNAATFDYVIMDGSNMRAGNIASVWNGSSSSHNEINTTDLGNTNNVNFDVSHDGKLNVVVNGGTWTVQINYKAIGNINL